MFFILVQWILMLCSCLNALVIAVLENNGFFALEEQ